MEKGMLNKLPDVDSYGNRRRKTKLIALRVDQCTFDTLKYLANREDPARPWYRRRQSVSSIVTELIDTHLKTVREAETKKDPKVLNKRTRG